jgi:hypothetical protein
VGDAASAWWLLSDGVVALKERERERERERVRGRKNEYGTRAAKRNLLFSLLFSFICFSSSN